MVSVDIPLMQILMSFPKILGLFATLMKKPHTHVLHFWKLLGSTGLGLFRPHLPWSQGGKGGSVIMQQTFFL